MLFIPIHNLKLSQLNFTFLSVKSRAAESIVVILCYKVLRDASLYKICQTLFNLKKKRLFFNVGQIVHVLSLYISTF